MNKIRFFRMMAGKSQEELAFAAKVSQAKISRLERNVAILDKKEMKRICDVLGIEEQAIKELFGE